jgi:FHA domain-containing protein
MAATAQSGVMLPESRSVNVSTSALPNVFDGPGIPLRPAATPRSDRPLLIPADFDPFARDVKKETAAKDPWAGGLPEQSLSQVANIQSDELIRSLPLKGKLDDELDNPAHSGLPRALDPKLETDPMRLFGTAGVMDDLVVPNAETARGPELVQVFNLPRGVDPGAPGPRKVLASTALHANPGVVSDRAGEAAQSNNATTVEALGLLPTQGLDLALFGGADVPGATNTIEAVATAASNADTLRKRSSQEAVSALGDSAKPVLADPKSLSGAEDFFPDAMVQQMPAAVASEPAAAVGQRVVSVDLDLDQPPPASRAKAVIPEPPASRAMPDAKALMDAFLEGAGLASGRVEALMTPDFMRQFGEAFRVAVQGTIELLAARSEIKREFRADVTVIAPRANNPLKFLPNADGVIMQMVGQSFPGFMKPVPSMKEAYFDLQVHQLALMAGIRAAYAEALARFDPVELEKRCDSNGGMLSKISTTARKAAVWDDYKQSYNAIRRHAEDDLVAFSGEAFVKAYDAAAEAAREYP